VEVPSLVVIVPVPLATGVPDGQLLAEYSAKDTVPVGAADVASAKVAVSPTVDATPRSAMVELANVVIVGEADATVNSSWAAPQALVEPLLLLSPP
jgi:hypothetical protein